MSQGSCGDWANRLARKGRPDYETEPANARASKMPREELPPAPPGVEPSPAAPVSRTWMVIGTIALLIGLAMGIIMSSLGR